MLTPRSDHWLATVTPSSSRLAHSAATASCRSGAARRAAPADASIGSRLKNRHRREYGAKRKKIGLKPWNATRLGPVPRDDLVADAPSHRNRFAEAIGPMSNDHAAIPGFVSIFVPVLVVIVPLRGTDADTARTNPDILRICRGQGSCNQHCGR